MFSQPYWVKLSVALKHSGLKSRKTLISYAEKGHIIGKKGPTGQWQFDLNSINALFTPTANQRAIDIIGSLG